MKKLIGLFMALLLIVGAVSVFAQQTVEVLPGGVVAVELEENDTAEDEKTEAEDEEAETEETETRPVFANIREKIRARLERTKEKYERAKENYNEKIEDYGALANIRAAKAVIARCADRESEECSSARAQIRIHSRNFLLNTADRILDVLEKLKARIEANGLDEGQKAEMLADLSAKIEEIKEAKAAIEDLDNESTKEEIRKAVQAIRQAWLKTRFVMKRSAGRLVNEKIGGVIVKAGKLKEKLQQILDRLEADDYDVGGIEEQLTEFDAKIQEAKEKYEEAKALYQSAAEPGQVDEMMKEANALMREARSVLKEAHFILKDIVFSIKGLKDGQSILETSEGEIEEEAEEIEDEADDEDEEEMDNEDETEDETEEEEEDEAEYVPRGPVVVIGSAGSAEVEEEAEEE